MALKKPLLSSSTMLPSTNLNRQTVNDKFSHSEDAKVAEAPANLSL
jgi:hypothetical protein